MIGTEIELPVADGVLSGADFGGQGGGVLLVHGSGHNAAARADGAAHPVRDCHPIAVDLRGHGQARLVSANPEQYWRDTGSVITALSDDGFHVSRRDEVRAVVDAAPAVGRPTSARTATSP